MELNETIRQLADRAEPDVIRYRRQVHTYAEVAETEFKTKALVLEQARRLGLPWEEVPTTSVIVRLETGRPGRCVALRADMDALPMAENPRNLTGPRTCCSEQPGTAHGCGHDAHTAMLLGAMQVLTALRDRLCGTVLFCFEEGEERGSGVRALLDALEKYKVDFCWAIHVYAGLEEGKMSVDPGPRMAGASLIDVRFTGRGGHSSRPDLSVNPVFCGAAFLNELCVAFSNQITAGQTVTMGITMFHAGEALNVIPNTAEIKGTFRFFDLDEGRHAMEIVRAVGDHTAAIHRCQVEYCSNMLSYICQPVVTDPYCAEAAQRALQQVLPAGTLVRCEPWYASEAFGRWLARYKGVFAFLGIRNLAGGYGAEHHNDRFDLNESVLKTGVIATARYAVEMLQQA